MTESSTRGWSLDAIVAPPSAKLVDSADGERQVIEHHLQANASRYTPGSEPAEVELLRVSKRAAARLYWYRVRRGAKSSTLVIKVHLLPVDSARAGETERLRFVEPAPLAVKYAREYTALELLQQKFSTLDDARFGVVPILDRIDSARAVVMREITGQPLKELFVQLSRIYLRPHSEMLRVAVENAGAWLRAYHELHIDGALVKHPGRRDFISNVERYCNYLGVALSRSAFFDKLAKQVAALADAMLPDQLPMGLLHGDFAMRNILVGTGGKVVVFDTTALYRVPVYTDLAKFIMASRLSRVQAYTHGAAFNERQLRMADRWLLAGYGNEPALETQVRLYAVLILLDKWSFELAIPVRGTRMMAAARRRLVNSWYATQASALIRSLELKENA